MYSEYGVVYVKPKKNQIPNPYLLDNSLKVNNELSLIKINPNDKSSMFEKRALEQKENSKEVLLGMLTNGILHDE